VAHRQHPKTAQFLRRVEDSWRETRWHLTVQADLYTRLNLVLGFDKGAQKFICMDDSFAIVCHQPNRCNIPLIDNLGERRRTRTHEDLADTVVELLDTWMGTHQ